MASRTSERRRGASPRRSRRARLTWLIVVPVAVVGLLLAGLALGQRSLIYLPGNAAAPPAADVLQRGEDVELVTADGLSLQAYLARPAAEVDRAAAVLMAPGNAGSRVDRVGLATDLSDRGFTVLLLDYRGFGGNPGSPTEEGLHLDTRAAVHWLREDGFAPERTLYFGESLGTGVVAGLLADHPPAGAVLRSPFTDLPAVANRTIPIVPVGWLVRDRFPVAEQVAAATTPVTVVRGSADEVVPTEFSAQVAQQARTLVEEVVFDGARHNDPIMFGPEVADAVARMADQVIGD